MDEALQKIKELAYRLAEQASAEKFEEVIQQERLLTLYIQFKMLDMLDLIDSRLISLEDEVSKLNPLYK